MRHLITNIQRMCMHDGPGIRTTVFMKGCTLKCPWCSNPENLLYEEEKYELDGEQGIYGKEYTLEELMRELLKDEAYWIDGGGVTFSGGEALMHMDYLQGIMKMLKNRGVHIAVETALFVPESMLTIAVDYVDFFYVDIKILDALLCKKILGGDIELYKKNLAYLNKTQKKIVFRIPCNDKYTLNGKNQQLICELCKEHMDIPIEIFKVHSLGMSKYKSLRKKYYEKLSCEDIVFKDFYEILLDQGNKVKIIHL